GPERLAVWRRHVRPVHVRKQRRVLLARVSPLIARDHLVEVAPAADGQAGPEREYGTAQPQCTEAPGGPSAPAGHQAEKREPGQRRAKGWHALEKLRPGVEAVCGRELTEPEVGQPRRRGEHGRKRHPVL